LERIHGVVVQTAAGISAKQGKGAVSKRWHELKDHLDEWEDHHPRAAMFVGKVADALAVVGL